MTVADTVHEWFRQRLACGAIAQHTPAYNQARNALPALIAALEPTSAITEPALETREASAGDDEPGAPAPEQDFAPPSA